MDHTPDTHSAPAHTPSPLGDLKLESAQTQGGHEFDAPPYAQLFVILFLLSVFVLGAGTLVYNLLGSQTELRGAAAAERMSPIRAAQEAKDDATLGSWGVITVDDAPARYHQPIATAKAKVLGGRGLAAFK